MFASSPHLRISDNFLTISLPRVATEDFAKGAAQWSLPRINVCVLDRPFTPMHSLVKHTIRLKTDVSASHVPGCGANTIRHCLGVTGRGSRRLWDLDRL